MCSPFDEPPKNEHALWAVNDLRRSLESEGQLADGLGLQTLESAKGGTMLGVLVVRDPVSAELLYLRAFAGEVGGRTLVPGWAPPLYDVALYTERRVLAEGALRELEARKDKEAPEASLERVQCTWMARSTEIQAGIKALGAERREGRCQRKKARAEASPEQLRVLDERSRHLNARLQERKLAYKSELAVVKQELARAQRRVRAWRRLRRYISRRMLVQLQDTYTLMSLHCGQSSLQAAFHPKAPPGGAGDCAGVKLVSWAIALGLEPVALAETWWGAPPSGGARVSGGLYPACQSKCGPILAHMLRGADILTPVRSGPDAPDLGAVLPILFEDDELLVINKPPGLLSVPGRQTQDSAQTRLRARCPDLRAVHRLDQDASGILVLAKTPAALRWAQAEFSGRRVYKRYEALLDGAVQGDSGEIRLAFRLDPEQRPRQVYDPVQGKVGITRWQVLRRSPGCTRVSLEPITGRTHQLRCHMAHALGLGAPIHGDRLYGRADARLMLHSVQLRMTSPSGRDYHFEVPSLFDSETE